jgi:hypothetical protein
MPVSNKPSIEPEDIVISGDSLYKLPQAMAFFGYAQNVKSSATLFNGNGSTGARYDTAQIRSAMIDRVSVSFRDGVINTQEYQEYISYINRNISDPSGYEAEVFRTGSGAIVTIFSSEISGKVEIGITGVDVDDPNQKWGDIANAAGLSIDLNRQRQDSYAVISAWKSANPQFSDIKPTLMGHSLGADNAAWLKENYPSEFGRAITFSRPPATPRLDMMLLGPEVGLVEWGTNIVNRTIMDSLLDVKNYSIFGDPLSLIGVNTNTIVFDVPITERFRSNNPDLEGIEAVAKFELQLHTPGYDYVSTHIGGLIVPTSGFLGIVNLGNLTGASVNFSETTPGKYVGTFTKNGQVVSGGVQLSASKSVDSSGNTTVIPVAKFTDIAGNVVTQTTVMRYDQAGNLIGQISVVTELSDRYGNEMAPSLFQLGEAPEITPTNQHPNTWASDIGGIIGSTLGN